ncbi:MAG: metallophosphoesterase [Atribacterota bacterium]|nr:metallophosphoesterase [Atribacterota bacterium]MDD4895869.1 metallophosphoesterase [Atribacterota bacterium]MDD5637849.1 metallophosphoesterase [Atribacterota bacterium]
MKIGIIADTHDNLTNLKKAVEIFNKEKIDLLLHAGDFVSPFTARELKNILCPFAGVFGNNDGDRLLLQQKFQQIGSIYPEPFKINANNRTLIMFHKNDVIKELAKSQQYDIIIYGHTHKVDYYKEGKTTVINPGECGGWLTGQSTIAILDLTDLSAHIIEL